jgi:ribosomal protein S18 acetylase RimI-like enzyme
MHGRNETSGFDCRFLSEDYFSILLEKFIVAFSDYERPFEFDEDRFRNHIVLNAIDLNRSVGCFRGDELVGFSLNGFGMWNGKPTVYDAGTGVVPNERRSGASKAMFDLMIPALKAAGAEQMLLEVITINEPAVNLYKKLGFEIQRELLLLEAPGKLKIDREPNMDVAVHRIPAADLSSFLDFWDGTPSWQNSNEAIVRSERMKTILGAFLGERCVGYLVFSSGLGRVAQFVVDKNYRRHGVGERLLMAMQDDTKEGCKMQVLNIDSAVTETVQFLLSRGFETALSQFEMIKLL